MRKYQIILLATLFVACTSQVGLSSRIEAELVNSNWYGIDLKEVATFEWESVCIIGPYATQEHQNKILGFKSKLLSSTDDGVSVLAFIRNNKVTKYIKHPRNRGDFLGASDTCFNREGAVFIREPNETGDWVTLVVKNA